MAKFMHNKSKSLDVEGEKKYLNFMDYRRNNAFLVEMDTEVETGLSLSQLGSSSPYALLNRPSPTQRKHISLVGIFSKKQEIKGKIKDRIKAEIQSLIKRNTFKIKKVESNTRKAKQIQPCQSVGVVGSSFQRPFVQQVQQQKVKHIKNVRKSIVLSNLVFNARKAKSSLDNRPMTVEEISIDKAKQKVSIPHSYRRSMSTDIRVKSTTKRKVSQGEFTQKAEKIKDDTLQPWIISSFAQEEQNFQS